MIEISKIDWGSVDANQDDTLPRTFVNSSHLRSLLSERTWIVSGEKGSGKTAIKRAFTDPSLAVEHPYQFVGAVDFDELEFETFQDNLINLAKVARTDPLRLLTNFWKFTLIAEAAKELVKYGFHAELASGADALSQRLSGILHSAGGSAGKRFRQIIRLPVAWFIEDNPTENHQDAILAFPLETPGFIELKANLFRFLESRNKKNLIVLDGFDSVCTLARDPAYNSAIFEGLCQAVLDLRDDPKVRQWLHFKVLLPHDRFLPMLLRGVGENPVRDAVKIRDIHRIIMWNRERLLEFVAKRVNASTGRTQASSDAVSAILPAKVQNGFYTSVEEDALDYLLRHTMWRPRQVQQHLVKLTELFPDAIIDARQVRVAVAHTCKELVQEFIEEYSIDHPNISHFIRMFNNQPNIMPYSDFTEILKGAIARFDGSNKWSGKNGFNQKLEALYRMGFFGIVQEIDEGAMIPPDIEYLPPAKLHGRRYYMDFYYRSNPVEAVHLRVPNEALVAIHPIFTNHCNMRPHPTMIVG